MSERVNVLYLPSPRSDDTAFFGDAVVAIVGERHNLRIFDHGEDLAPQFKGIDVVVDLGGSVGTREMLDAADGVRLWQILGMGIDHFDLEYWRKRGMPVANCPGPLSAIALAESAMMMILMLSRRYAELRTNIERSVMYGPVGFELVDRSLLLVGFGASARELSIRASAFGMRVSGVDVVVPDDPSLFGAQSVVTPEQLDDLIPEADFVSLHLPLNEETRHTLDARRLSLMKPDSYVINVARGALVDEPALVAALSEGRLAGAGLDVFGEEPLPLGSPLFDMPNVVLTPHIAGATDGTARRRAEAAAENCDRVAQGLEPLYRVD